MNEMIRIVPATDNFKARFTTAEFLRMVDNDAFENWKVELVDGELERMQQPMSFHAMRQAQIVIKLAQAVGADVLLGEAGIIVSDDTVLTCDAAVLRAPIAENRRCMPEDMLLIVEVAESTRDRDLGMKRRKYAEAGVSEYWVIDGGRSIIHVFRSPANGDFDVVEIIRFGEPLPVPGTDVTLTLS